MTMIVAPKDAVAMVVILKDGADLVAMTVARAEMIAEEVVDSAMIAMAGATAEMGDAKEVLKTGAVVIAARAETGAKEEIAVKADTAGKVVIVGETGAGEEIFGAEIAGAIFIKIATKTLKSKDSSWYLNPLPRP
jgi:transcriptional regulator with GAF, ATPase, and Fis domain